MAKNQLIIHHINTSSDDKLGTKPQIRYLVIAPVPDVSQGRRALSESMELAIL
jgi:hypothetical protein